MTFWTQEQDNTLGELWGSITATEIGKVLGKTKNAVIARARRTNLPSIGPSAIVWTREMDEVIIQAIKGQITLTQASATLNVSDEPVSNRARKLKGKTIVELYGKTLADLGQRDCRFSVTPHDSTDHRFCGEPTHKRHPYCLEHCRKSYYNITQKDVVVPFDG